MKQETKNCYICGALFDKKGQNNTWWKTAKFCSNTCYSRRGVSEETRLKHRANMIGNTRCLGYKHTEEAKRNMVASRIGKPSPLRGRKLTELHREKVISGLMKNPHRFSRGEKPWNWKEDRTQVKIGDRHLHDPRYKEWHKAIKNRDGWKCKISNGDCSGRLEAHHILPWSSHPELRYEVNNGIALCHFHHPRKREDEMKLSPFFQSLVASQE